MAVESRSDASRGMHAGVFAAQDVKKSIETPCVGYGVSNYDQVAPATGNGGRDVRGRSELFRARGLGAV